MSVMAEPAVPEDKREIALYRDQEGTAPTVLQVTWDKLCELLTRYGEESPCTVDTCIGAKCPHKSHSSIPNNPMVWSPVSIEGKRLDTNVRFVNFLVLDFDHLTPDVAAQVVEKVLPWAHIQHTTHNHREGDACFRIVLRLSRAVHANVWHRFLYAVVAFLDLSVVNKDGINQPDRVCKNRSRFYYRPSHPSGAPYFAQARQGAVVDVDAVLAWADANLAPETAAFTSARPLPEQTDWDIDGQAVLDAIDLMTRYFPHKRRHDLCMALGGMLRRAGASEEVAEYIVREIAAQGGSDNPDMRAATVRHTYGLTDDGAMTGFTRVAEIVGEDVAEEFGDYLTDARNEAFLRGMGTPLPAPSSTALALVPATATVDLGVVRKTITDLAARRSRSMERDDKIDAILLRRALNGQPLAQPGGVGDVETVYEGADRGLGRESAMRKVIGILAFTLPTETPWIAVQEILRSSLHGMTVDPGDKPWLERAEKVWKRSQATKTVQQAQAAAEREAFVERERALGGPSITPPGEPPDGPNWRDRLLKGGNGAVANNTHNARVILENHEDFCGHIRWNEIAKRIEITGGPLASRAGKDIDGVITTIQDFLISAHGLQIPFTDLAKRATAIARKNPFDPLKDYLNSLVWDGQERITNWLRVYCGARQESDRYLKEVGRKWLIALVARALAPGCKVDNVLVLEAPPGVGKSTAFEVLGGEWFCDTAINLGDKDSRMMAGQYWICEMAEIVAFKKTGHDTLKSFFSSRVDKFRPPYGASYEESPRRCVFVGTTNEDSYLGDETGNRKYWPVACSYTAGATEALRRDRDQLLAEAVAAFKAGEGWYFSYEELQLTEDEAEKRMVETPAKLLVTRWWYSLKPKERPTEFTTMDVAEAAMDALPTQIKPGDLMSIGHALRKMGFVRRRESNGAKRGWRYYPTSELINAETIMAMKKGMFSVIEGGKSDGAR